jgi:peroxiredoxin Q/BCP
MRKTNIDEPVPDFSAQATGNKTIRLSDLRGSPVVLYFYPKDNTPGCTLEGKDFRDHYARFRRLKAVVLGVSRDGLKSHESFKEAHQLPFDLLSDEEERLCDLFDVIRMKSMYGKRVRGIERSTFLIDGKGVLRREWRKVKIEGHAEEVLEAIKDL